MAGFSNEQQHRLAALVRRWREARDAGSALPADEQAELEALVEAELLAATERASELLAKQHVYGSGSRSSAGIDSASRE